MIISGLLEGPNEQGFKIVKGGGTVVWPVIQQYAFLNLDVMTMDVCSAAPIVSKNGIPLIVKAVAQVKVPGDYGSLAAAAQHFLGKSDAEIKSLAFETFAGQLQALIGTLTVEELIGNLDQNNQRIQQGSNADLSKMGLAVVLFNINEIKDDVGYLDALAAQTNAEARRKAAILLESAREN